MKSNWGNWRNGWEKYTRNVENKEIEIRNVNKPETQLNIWNYQDSNQKDDKITEIINK